MAIAQDAAILFFGTQDEQTTGTPSTVASGAFSDNNDTVTNWTNDDDAPLGAAVLKCAFGVAVTIGSVGLYAKLKSIQSTNDAPDPDANFPHIFVGSFPIDFGASTSTLYYPIPLFQMPCVGSSQAIQWFIKNEGTAQTISASWQLWITPIAEGPHPA